MFHYRVHNSPSPVPVLSQISLVRSPKSHFWRSILILSSHLRLGLPNGLFPSCIPTRILRELLLSRHTCYMPRLSLFFCPNPLIVFSEEYRSLSSSLCSLLYSPVTLSLLVTNMFLSTLFSNILSVCSSLIVTGQVSHPYQTTGIISFLMFLDSLVEDKELCFEF
jgi:hypothetical protein